MKHIIQNNLLFLHPNANHRPCLTLKSKTVQYIYIF